MQMPNLAAAREVASSPSGWASFCDAAGLNPKGRETCIQILVSVIHLALPGKSPLCLES